MEISFILYKPSTSGNIGAAARAIKTMGHYDLRLISPCDHLSEEAKMFAHASHDILKNAKIFNSFEESIKGIDFIIGTSAKKRKVKTDYIAAQDLKLFLQTKRPLNKFGIVFGTEESGLPNEILGKCDIASTIPMKTTYPSLNLGQSVMLYAYELNEIPPEIINTDKVSEDSFNTLKIRIKKLLTELGIPEEMPLHPRILERISQMNSTDMNLLHSVSSRLIKDQRKKSSN